MAFIDDPAIQAALTANTMQIGFLAWATGSAQANPTGTGESMLGAVTGAQARSKNDAIERLERC